VKAFPLHWLRPGDRIHVIAPAGPFDVARFERGVSRLRERYEVVHHPTITERTGYLAGSDRRRTDELRAALQDEGARGIVAARGGYGSTRLLEHVSAEEVTASPKLLVGFSDITALHALWARAGLGSIHGPMVATLGGADETLLSRWVRAVEGELPQLLEGLTCIAPGQARGRLVGGNLAVLGALLGTPYAPPLDDCVLFLEDVGERPYRVDRLLTSMRHAGWLSRVAAVVLGAFTEAPAGPDGVEIDQVLRERLAELGVPVLSGVPAGHVDDNLELPFGAIARVDAERGSLSFDG
jgi:muramoyltetrapeptide carboxypeptidase